mgnify:CR=1 FL=1
MTSFAKRLAELSSYEISVAQNDEILKSQHIYLCCGRTSVSQNGPSLYFSEQASQENHFNPDINLLFNSFVAFANEIEILGVILTGIGDDGVDGCKTLSLNGCVCATQSEESAIVDGMPSRARAEVPNVKVGDIEEIAKIIREFCS